MDFLYPKLDKPTHIVKKGSINSIVYPSNDSFNNSISVPIAEDTKVVLIRNNIGFDCKWAQVKIIEGASQERILYVLNSELINTSSKVDYVPICTFENSIDEAVPEIDPNIKEVFVPYIDKKNGLFSVRIQTDYEKVLDSFVFDNLLQDVLFEGLSILFASRGIKSDNGYIQQLLNKFQSIAFINNDLDLTVNRDCEPLTFTVSTPLNFFNEQELTKQESLIGEATKVVEFNNINYNSLIRRLTSILSSIREDVEKLLYPNNFIENFVIDFELSAIKEFDLQFKEYTSLQNYSVNDLSLFTDYMFGFDDNLNIAYIKFKNANGQKVLNQAELSYFKLKPSLNSKRIFNYFLNLDQMSADAASLDVKEFIFKYVKYPDPKIIKDTIIINGKALPEEKAEQFKKDQALSNEQCINLSDVSSISKSTLNIISYTDPLYHIFVKKDVDNLEDYNTYKSFINEGKSVQDALKSLKDSQSKQKSEVQKLLEKKNKEELQRKADDNIKKAKQESDALSLENLKNRKELENINNILNPNEDVEVESELKQKLLDKKFELEQKQQEISDKLKIAKSNNTELERQKNLIQSTPADKLVDITNPEEVLGTTQEQIDGLSAAFNKIKIKEELKETLNISAPVNFMYSNAAGQIVYDDSNKLSISTVLYILNRINVNEVLFKKLLCTLKGTDPNSPEIASILSQLPVQILNYFNYLQANSTLNGTAYIRALEAGAVPDIKLYCSQSNGLIYFVKGLRQVLTNVEKAEAIILNILPNLGKLPKPTTNPYEVFVKNLIQNSIRIIASVLLDVVKELLQTSCEDPILDLNNNNFSDPFNTHYPAQSFGGSSTNSGNNNNNPNILNDNRKTVLENVYQNELEFGFDREYTVDLIGRLLNDINCILTPLESVNLLRGEPTELVKTLIKNIIRTKYSAPPNDLTFLLSDDEKLKLLFKQLGLTVDPGYIETTNEIVTNYLEQSNVCDEPTLKARTDLLKGKLPKELGTLDRRLQTRTQTAKKLFERIKNGETVIEVSPLCPDLTNDDVEAAKDKILNNYVNFVNSSFANILTNFTQEAKQLPEVYKDKRILLRKEGENPFDSIEYYLYNSELGLNLIGQGVGDSVYIDRINENTTSYSYRYGVKGLKDQIKDLAKILIPRNENVSLTFCPEKEFKLSDDFQTVLDSGNILVEFAGASGDFQFDDRGDGSGDLGEYYDGSDRSKLPDAEYIKQKEYIITISLNKDPDPLGILDYDEVSIKFIYNDTDNSLLRVLSSVNYEEGEISKDFISDNVLDAIDAVTDNVPNDEIYYLDEQPADILQNPYTIKKTVDEEIKAGKLVNINDSDDIYILSKSVFDKIQDIRVKQLLQKIFEEKFKKEIEKINNFKELKRQSENLEKLFESKTFVNKNDGYFKKEINAATGKFDSITNLPVVSTKNYVSWEDITINNNFEYKFDKSFYENNAKLTIDNVRKHVLNNSVNYFKTKFDYSDFTGRLKDGKWEFIDSKKIEEQINNPLYNIVYNPQTNTTGEKYNLYSLLDFPIDERYRKCNLYPHYLNLQYILQKAKLVKQGELCNLENYAADDILKIALVELTFRTHVTDLLVKSIPYLSCLSKNNLLNMHKRQTYVDVIREFFIKELEIFSPLNEDGTTKDKYYKYFSKITKEVYQKYASSTPPELNKEFVDNFSINEEVDYFIKKEINRFIKYSLEKGIFSPNSNENDYFNVAKKFAFFEGGGFGIQKQPDDPFGKFLNDLWIFEFESYLGYFIMSNTVDANKRTIFYSTKSELANMFFGNIGGLTVIDEADTNVGQNSLKSQEDVIKFLQNLAYSPSPAAMVLLKPEYSKYVKKYLTLVLQTTRDTLASVAQATDLNISTTRKISQISAFIATTTFAFLDDESKVKAIVGDPTLRVKRISDGKAPIEDLAVSLGLSAFGMWPTLLGWSYLTVDTIQESIYLASAQKEVEQLRNSIKTEQPIDPCAITPKQQDEIANNTKCTPNNKKALIQEINQYDKI